MPVERRLDLGGSFVCHRALVAGELDLYPEYTGTAFTAILKEKPIVGSRGACARGWPTEYARRWGLVWAPPLGFENTFALVMRRDDARRLGIAKISDLARHAGADARVRLRVPRARGRLRRGSPRPTGSRSRARPAEMDLGLLYPALAQGKVDVVAGNSTDGLIAAMGLAVLEDDRRYFPPYEAAFVVRGAVVERPRACERALEPLVGRDHAPRRCAR